MTPIIPYLEEGLAAGSDKPHLHKQRPVVVSAWSKSVMLIT